MKIRELKISFEKVAALWFGFFGLAPVIGFIYAAVRLKLASASVQPITWTFLLWCLPNLIVTLLLIKEKAAGWIVGLLLWMTYGIVFTLASNITDKSLPSRAVFLIVSGILIGFSGLANSWRRHNANRN